MIRNVEQRLEVEEENAKHLSRPFLTKVDIRLGVPCSGKISSGNLNQIDKRDRKLASYKWKHKEKR